MEPSCLPHAASTRVSLSKRSVGESKERISGGGVVLKKAYARRDAK
jgi:hypothetical protein